MIDYQVASVQKSLALKFSALTSQYVQSLEQSGFIFSDGTMRLSHVHCDLPIGILILSTAKHDSSLGGTKAHRDGKQRLFRICFVPPASVSAVSFQCSIHLQWLESLGLMSIQARLIPLTVNREPCLMEALKELDLSTLRLLIQKGIVKTTDHVLDLSAPPNVVSLIDVILLRAWLRHY